MSIASWLMYACMLVSALIAHEIGHGLQRAQANIPAS